MLGNSFGGMVALSYALRHPTHPGKFVLVSTTARFELEPALAMFARLAGGAADVARRFFADPRGLTEKPNDFRAGHEVRTRDPQLGKLMLYQLS